MRQISQSYSTGKLVIEEVPAPLLRPGGVLVHTRCSIISAGTERTKVETARMSLLDKARARPDLVAKVLDKVRRDGIAETIKTVRARLQAPTPMGYSSAGIVIEVGAGVEGFRVGDEVSCAGGGYANHAEIAFIPKNLCAPVPKGLGLDVAATATLGAIAMQGVRRGECRVGEVVAVVGLGIVGQLAAQICAASGCRVVGFDPASAMVQLARDWGMDDAHADEESFQDAILRLSSGHGADAVLVCAATASSAPMELAGRIARDRGEVVSVGLTGMAIPREMYYRKELSLKLSRSYGPGRYDPDYEEKGRDYPYAHVRWTERRNMESFLDLAARGRIPVARLLTHRFPLERAGEAYQMLVDKSRPQTYLGIVLEYPHELPARGRLELAPAPKPASDRLRIGLIGAGNYAQAHLLPHLPSVPGAALTAIVTATGLTARAVAKKYGIARCHDKPEALLADADVDAVLIATRHDQHAALAAAALAAGKHVFVEKPLALDIEGLRAVAKALSAAKGKVLQVGFNRRHAAASKMLADFLGASRPLVMVMRVNAGAIAPDHWLLDPDQGGGRMLGEGCHFVDLAQHWAGSPIVGVSAAAARGARGASVEARGEQDVAATLSFADGSVASIVYTSLGDAKLGKERYEIFAGGKTAVIDDFRVLETWEGGRHGSHKARGSAKGQLQEMALFADLCLGRVRLSESFHERQLLSSLATVRLVDSLREGRPQAVRIEDIAAEMGGQ